MPLDYVALKSEINNDPKGLGYASLVTIGSDAGIALLLNSPTGAGADSVPLQSIPKDSMLLGIAPAAFVLSTKSALVQAQYQMVIQLLTGSGGNVDLTNSVVKGIIAQAVLDGVLTQVQVDSFTRRIGSRAEVLFGVGTVVAHRDVAIALRG